MNVKNRPLLLEEATQLKERISGALEYYEVPTDVDLSVLNNWIIEADNPMNFITRVFHEAHFESEIEAEKLLDLMTRLWNITPRKELGGLSPQQKLNAEMHKKRNA